VAVQQRIPLRTWVLTVLAAARMLVTGRHVYLSTGCIAGEHDYCSAPGSQGAKAPARSKFSDAPCICWCHDP
jgi:hypothetical protein